ncbi:DUF3445 domain-containing protein [Cryobacterium sp. TMT1-3]|uniref:heme-dependent oxidative N-demethylase family protein n=1 Tax=Cryobacterium sp. TMT1-3 TaxID=1259237 RepID=UPI00106C21A0|nr:DUF3445 domain-containing protein [Cryobacterium sp. TMT1-3]TFC25071.1 DUF3445 domain-containing protein [Cryobacterium sp. TMT1-3]
MTPAPLTDTAPLPDPASGAPFAERARHLPFPFTANSYRYSANVEPAPGRVDTDAGHWGENIIDIDCDYRCDLAERAEILARDPSRCQTLAHMRPAVWDVIETLLPIMAADYPEMMAFYRDGLNCSWRNDLLGLELEFVIGDDSSLGMDPLVFIGGQIQDDIALLDARDGALWLDAGSVTFAADWCLGFDVGMRFTEIHGPVPRVHEERIVSRAEQFLLRLQPGDNFRRTNWTMTVDRRLDTSTDSYPEWGADRRLVLLDPALPDRLHLRVEVQHLIRLPRTGAVLFLVRSYLVSLTEIATVPAWRRRLGQVLAELPADMAEYKGIDRYRASASAWLLGS